MSTQNLQDTAQFVLENLKKNGASKAGVFLTQTTKYELNVEREDITLYRTTENTSVSMSALVGTKRGVVRTNNLLPDALLENSKKAVSLANVNKEDSGNDISPSQDHKNICVGDEEPDSESMYKRLKEFLDYAKVSYPTLKFDNCIFSFDLENQMYANTNSVLLHQKIGSYSFSPMFFAKDKNGVSSFNSGGATHLNLNTPLQNWGNLDELMKQSCEQTKTEKLNDSFVGDVILTPDVVLEFIYTALNEFLGDMSMITNSSIWKDKLNEQVVSTLLTVALKPEIGGVEIPNLITDDGFIAKNTTIIDKGILKSFLLNLYGMLKTNKPRCPAGSYGLVIEPGTNSRNALVKNVKRGILLSRFSGGHPAPNGDFSGVAKNSYLIENGVITKPLSETMVAGNTAKVLESILGISSETINFGSMQAPWIHSTGITISG